MRVRRIFGMMLAIALVVSAACGGDDDDGDGASPSGGGDPGKTVEARFTELLVAPEGLGFEESEELRRKLAAPAKALLEKEGVDADIKAANIMTEEGLAGVLGVYLFDPKEKKTDKTIEGIIKGYGDQVDGERSSATLDGEKVDFVESETLVTMFWRGDDFLVSVSTPTRAEAEAFGDLYFGTLRSFGTLPPPER